MLFFNKWMTPLTREQKKMKKRITTHGTPPPATPPTWSGLPLPTVQKKTKIWRTTNGEVLKNNENNSQNRCSCQRIMWTSTKYWVTLLQDIGVQLGGLR